MDNQNEHLEYRRFVSDAERVYNVSIQQGKYVGDEYQANCIVSRFKDRFEDLELQELKQLAEIEHSDRWKKRKEQNDINVIPPPHYIQSRMIIEKCIEKRIKLPLE